MKTIENEMIETEAADIENKLPEESAEGLTDTMKQYLREIGRIPLLSQEEEFLLGRRVQAGKDAKLLLKELKQEGGAEPSDLQELQKLVKQGKDAMDRLTEANLRLVVNNARKYTGRGLSLQDLIQEGSIGLMKAAEKFDPEKGNRFSTVASWWIRQRITRAVTDYGRSIRLPSHIFQQVSHLRTAETELTELLDRAPTDQELAAAMQLPLKKLQELRRYAQDTASLEAPLGKDGDGKLDLSGVLSGGSTTDEVDERLTGQALRAVLATAIAGLDDRERQVLTMRYDLDGRGVRTLEQIGSALNLTRERVRQIEQRALRTIRTGPCYRELKEFIA